MFLDYYENLLRDGWVALQLAGKIAGVALSVSVILNGGDYDNNSVLRLLVTI